MLNIICNSRTGTHVSWLQTWFSFHCTYDLQFGFLGPDLIILLPYPG